MESNDYKSYRDNKSFHKDEILNAFIDGNYIIKLGGEDVWYLINSRGETIVRTTPEGKYEFAEVDFYGMVGEPYFLEFSSFKDGIVVAKFLCNDNGNQVYNFYEISPMGYTYNTTKTRGDAYLKNGVEFRSQELPTSIVDKKPINIKNIELMNINSQEYLKVVYDVSMYRLKKGYESFVDGLNKPSNVKERTFFTVARNIQKRYEFLKDAIERKKIKQNEKNNKTKQDESDLKQPE